jgi:fibro-slime domain-containing protein
MPRRFSLPRTLLAFTALVSIMTFRSSATVQFPDTLWVPVIFYDYHADGRADFETCEDPNSTVGKKGMVAATLDAQKKPIAIPAIACPSSSISFPCACNLTEWFRVSGQSGFDNTVIFQCDSLTNPEKPRWSWSNLVPYQSRPREFTGPSFNASYPMANVIMYDSLCFLLVPNSNGVYQFADDAFFPLDGRGFGNEPPIGTYNPELHNFGFTMEMHTKFKYQKGLTFTFRGDDDVWAFINGRLVMDLGGTHSWMDGFVNLDTIAGLVPDQTYSFDLYYAERHSAGSHIRINSNVISASPSEVRIDVFPSDTIAAGDTATIIGTIVDKNGKALPIQSDSIRWTQDRSNVKPGDQIVTAMNDSTEFTGTVAFRRIGIVGTYRSGNVTIIDTAWIYIKPGDPALVDIARQSATPQARNAVAAALDTFTITPRQTITLTIGQNTAYAYAVLRDRFSNFCSFADASAWASLNAAIATVTYTAGGAFEGTVGRAAGARTGSTTVTVSQGTLIPDTAEVVLLADSLLGLRLVNVANPGVALDSVRMNTDSTITVKLQGIWSTSPNVWADVTGTWTLNPAGAVLFTVPLPLTPTGQWTINPSTPGVTNLTVTSLNASVTVPVIVLSLPALDSAITRDVNGNGLIDRIDLAFSRDAAIPATVTGNFSIKYGAVTFPVASIVQVDARHFHLLLREQPATLLQTSWTPTVTIAAIPDVASGSITSIDGCAPVLYRVIRYAGSASDPSKDTVRVFLSEKGYNPSRGTMYLSNQPVESFITWWGESGNALADSLLAGIPSFTAIRNDSILVFSMFNRRILTAENWMNIRAVSRYLCDKAGNFPDTQNRRVRVEVVPAFDISTFPNPSGVTLKRVRESSILVEIVRPGQKSEVENWVKTDKAGTIISLKGLIAPPPRPDNSSEPVRLRLKIYDVAGNSVTWLSIDDLFKVKDLQAPSAINLYWNGLNKKGMRSAPGVYRAVIYIDYPALSGINDISASLKIGLL